MAGKHCHHPGRKRLARRRRLMFLAYDLVSLGIVVWLVAVIVSVILILMEGGR